MSTDNDKNKPDDKADSLPSFNEFADIFNRTLNFTSRGVGDLLDTYSEGWKDTISETLNSSLPAIILNGTKNGSPDYQDVWSNAGYATDDTSVPLDTTKPDNIWAFPVPSTKQYQRCKDLQGTSVWTRQGVWRCLFPQSQNLLENELNKPVSDTGRQIFGDYNAFLDWKVYMRRLKEEKIEKQREELQRKWQENREKYAQAVETTVSKTGEDSPDKKVVSSSVSTHSYTKDDGTFETKKTVKKWYEDGTSSTVETVSNGPDTDSPSGWFWKWRTLPQKLWLSPPSIIPPTNLRL